MKMRSRITLAILLTASLSLADAIDDIKPGEWYEAPNSKMAAVQPTPLPTGATGQQAVMSAWSGGSFDSKRDRLVIWGGGHSDYAGNEIYVFDVKTLKWSRLTEPSKDVAGNESSGIYPDGTPRARHTYDYVQYVPSLDAFCTFGGAGLYPSGQTGTDKTHCFDFAANKWVLKGDAVTSGIGSVSAVDPETGMAWIQGGGGNGEMAQWDPLKNSWKKMSTYFKGWFDYYQTAAAGRGKLLALGNGSLVQWDLKNPTKDAADVTTTGDTKIISADNPGFTFDTKHGWFVAWNGGADVYVLEIGAKVWKKVPLASTNKVTPTSAQATGTYGRFQYVASKNAFIAVNRVNEDVYFFKLPTALDLTVVPAVLAVDAPKKPEFQIDFQGGAWGGFRAPAAMLSGLPEGSRLSCRIFSAQKEILRAESEPISAGNLVFRMNGNAVPAAGAYFLRIEQGNHLLLSRPLAKLP